MFTCRFVYNTTKMLVKILFKISHESRLAQQAMKQLPTDVIQGIQNSALWSREEEKVISEVLSVCIRENIYDQ